MEISGLLNGKALKRNDGRRLDFRRWKSEYQTTYKPFWRFDYKDGKWYKDAEAVRWPDDGRSIERRCFVHSRNRLDSIRICSGTEKFWPIANRRLNFGPTLKRITSVAIIHFNYRQDKVQQGISSLGMIKMMTIRLAFIQSIGK